MARNIWLHSSYIPSGLNNEAVSPYCIQPYSGGIQTIRKAFQRKNITDRAIETILRSLSEATVKQYSTTYRLWWDYCRDNGLHLLQLLLPTVCRFLKGVSRLRPATPKYNTTWDPQQVLSYLEEIDLTGESDLKHLSQKLVTLLALVTGQRAQTLALIKIKNIVKTYSGLQLFISDPIKTSGVGRTQPCLNAFFCRETIAMCGFGPYPIFRRD
nr:unnamed protein product [Callosobruchus analis]